MDLVKMDDKLKSLVSGLGHKLKAWRQHNTDEAVVLVERENTSHNFVTWRTDGFSLYWGHYFEDKKEADKDFWER